MITFGRLPLAVSLGRLFFLILAVSSLSADVRAQGTVKVGYYDMVLGAGVVAEQEPPITAAGFTPVRLFNVTATDLAGIHVLFVQNPSNNTVYGAEYFAGRVAIQSAVAAGMVLVIHDRAVGPTTTRLVLPPIPAPGAPLGSGVFPTRVTIAPTATNIDVSDVNTLLASGPGGMVTDTNLDNGNLSNQGWVALSSVPAGRKALLHTGSPTDPNKAVTFSYPFGLGFVIYSSIPLDFYLKPAGLNQPPQPRDNFRNIYAPNVLAYAASLRPRSPTLTVEPATGLYGGTTTLTATLKSGSTALSGRTIDFSLDGTDVGSAQTDSSGTATLANASLGSIAAGSYAEGVRVDFAGSGLFDSSSGSAALDVTRAPLTVAAEDKSKIYGTELPAFTASYNGFVVGEGPNALGGTLTFSTPATGTSSVGPYAITPYGLTSDNYELTFIGGTLTVTPAAPLVITANNKNRLYGETNPTFDGMIAGIQGQDAVTASYATLATSSSPVGTYNIVPTLVDPDGRLANYGTPTVVNGVLTINPAPLKLTANGKNRLYGGTNPAFDGTLDGIQGQDNIAASYATPATSSSPVGTYDIVPTLLDPGGRLANYAVTVVNGVLAINPAPLSVTANNRNQLYGGTNPTFDGMILGIQGQDNITASYATQATSSSPVGTYDILPTLLDPGGRLANYAVTVVNGILAIHPAPLTVTANDKERLVGKSNPALTVTYAGLVNGDTPASLNVPPTVTTTAVPGSAAGTYPIEVRGALDPNYTITPVNGTLTVSPEGRMRGEGHIVAGGARNHFAFDVRERVRLGERGSLTLRIDRARQGANDDEDSDDDSDDDNRRNGGRGTEPRDDRFVSHAVTSVTFSDNPGFAPGRGRGGPQVDTVRFTGVGLWNGVAATFEATASDMGEPGRARDTFSITIRVGGRMVADIQGPLDGGNVQSNRLGDSR